MSDVRFGAVRIQNKRGQNLIQVWVIPATRKTADRRRDERRVSVEPRDLSNGPQVERRVATRRRLIDRRSVAVLAAIF